MRIGLFLISFLFSLYASALIEISGKAEEFSGQFIRMYEVSDFLTYTESKADVVKISEDGSFTLRSPSNVTSLFKLRIEDMSLELMARPDQKIELIVVFDEELNQGKLYNRELSFEIVNSGDEGLNELIWAYQKEYASFLSENHQLLVTKKILPKVLEFQEEMISSHTNSLDYFQLYLSHDLAALEDAVLGSEKKIYENFIEGKPIRYQNVGYMNLFRQFYQERFIQISQGKDGFRFLSAVNGTQEYTAMMEMILAQPYISNDTLAQLFALQGLAEVYEDETFKKEKVRSMIEIIGQNALNSQNESIAKNTLNSMNKLGRGSEAPSFSLRDAGGEVYHLEDFKEKPLLIFVWSAYSNTCLREMTFVEEYQEKYGDKIHFITINIDQENKRALKYMSEKEQKLLTLFRDAQYDFLDKYQIFSSPVYILISSQGEILQYPAKRPEQNLERDLYKLSVEN